MLRPGHELPGLKLGRLKIAGVLGACLALSLPHFAFLQGAPSPVTLVIATDGGEIVVVLDSVRAPVTVTNFLRYIDSGLFDGGSFYRTVRDDNQATDEFRIGVIQGGMNRNRADEAFPPIRLEGTRESGLRHLDGVISMARSTPNSATAEFFICIGDQPELDGGGRRNPDGQGFAAFGIVVSGMDLVRAIQQGEADGQSLTPPVRILSAVRQ